MMQPISADLIAYGACSNAGDVLIKLAIERLFARILQFTSHHVRLDRLACAHKNIIVGPGGLLSGAYDPATKPDELVIRYLTKDKVDEWAGAGKNVFFFGTGTNSATDGKSKPFSPASSSTMADLIAASRLVMLRGSADIVRIGSMCRPEDLVKFRFQPCPSVFLDRLFGDKPRVTDRIAVNFPLGGSINHTNYRTHPLNRFVEYAHSLGLTVCFMDNHPADVNPFVLEMFDETSHDQAFLQEISNAASGTKQAAQRLVDRYTETWVNHPSLPSRFNGFRFAFGNRLHSFLPFMAFDTPSVFMAAHPVRQPMALQYFNNSVFGAPTPYGGKVLEGMVDGMIERLRYFVRTEDNLRAHIRDERHRLWDLTAKNKWELLELVE